MQEEQTQECNICGAVHPIEHYYTITQKNGNFYRYKYCRTCHYHKTRPIRAKWSKENPERFDKLTYKAVRNHLDKQKSGIYLIKTDKGLYVGQSKHMKFRVSQQNTYKSPYSVRGKGGTILSWEVLEYVEDREKRKDREKYWIRKLKPALNYRIG